MAKLTAATRNRLPAKDFAEPKERKYPIENKSHAINAEARASGKKAEGKVDRAVARKYPGMGKGRAKEREEGYGHAPRFDPKARYGRDGKRMPEPKGEEGEDPGEGRREHAAGSKGAEKGNAVLKDRETSGARPKLPDERMAPASGPVRGDPGMEAAGSAPMAAQPGLGGAPQPGAQSGHFMPPEHQATQEQAVKLALALRGRQAGAGPASRFPK